MIKQRLNGFWVAAQFLTIMPPIIKRPFTNEELGQAVGFFPLVGLLLGLVLVGANSALALFFPISVRMVIILTLWIVLTGGLHLDGFLDACDGLFGGFTPEKRLEIMRDERVGAYALAGGVLLLLLIYTSLTAVSRLQPALLLAPILGRWSMSLALVRYPYARETGLGRTMKDIATTQDSVIATIVTVALAFVIGQLTGLIAFVAVFICTISVARFVLQRIPGLTGDIYGLLCIVGETAVLLVFVVGGHL